MAERQSARMSKITNDCLTGSGIGCFIAVYPYGDSERQRVKQQNKWTVCIVFVCIVLY